MELEAMAKEVQGGFLWQRTTANDVRILPVRAGQRRTASIAAQNAQRWRRRRISIADADIRAAAVRHTKMRYTHKAG